MIPKVLEHLEEIKEIRKILLELRRTVDTDGCYCPYNKVYSRQAKVVHEIREKLREEIENDDP